jgi:hypothetical protein
MRKAPLLLFLVLCIPVCGAAFRARAEELALRYDSYTVDGGYFYLKVGFVGEISYDTVDAIRNGITANLVVSLHLVRAGGVLDTGREIAGQVSETFTVSYDVWDNVFLIKDRARKKEYHAVSSSEMLSQISGHMNPVRLPLSAPRKKGKYFVKGRIKIQTIRLFPPFGIFLYFFDPWNYDSGWIGTEAFEIEMPRE